MKILVWYIHGGWMRSFLRGRHDYLVPADAKHPFDPPHERVHEIKPQNLRGHDIDLVVLQRVEELAAVEELLGRVPGRDVPAVFVEHNTPHTFTSTNVHPLAEQQHIPIVHVTHFNRLMWDNGRAPTYVIEHAIPDPGYLYTGERSSLGLVVNEPVRRSRVAGTDLLPLFADVAPLDCFGIDTEQLSTVGSCDPERLHIFGDLPSRQLHRELARSRVYLHPFRWTSLGLSLLEAMMLGMPVLALAVTEAPRAVFPEAGAISANPDELVAAARMLVAEPAEARRRGEFAREAALKHYGLARFLHDWDAVIHERAAPTPSSDSAPMARDARPSQPTIYEGVDR